ncbi:MAG TPA: D-alanyl-D-alanine carboxypeptidase/D-alanyl-D-alanine-endopeptidase, partial [Edaphobacter sp.]
QPASNAKLFTTATAIALLGSGTTFETKVVAKGVMNGPEKLTGDLVLVGGGDANLSGRDIPYVAPRLRPKPAPPAPAALRYLEEMADQVAKAGLKVVNGDVVGDDTLFPWEPYAEDWSIDDTVWGYGAPVSALSINDNQIKVAVTPGAEAGKPATVVVDPVVPYYTVDVSGLVTGAAKSGSHVEMERALGSKVLRVYGSIAVDAQPDEEEVAIHDPAEYAAVALKAMLEARGVVVTGRARAEHRISNDARGFMQVSQQPLPGMDGSKMYGPGPQQLWCGNNCNVMAKHVSPVLAEDVTVTNKVSQNLHAEIFLHDLGAAVLADGSTVSGARVVRAFLEQAGIDRDDFVFFDGSGLSGHDLVTPRATVRLLQYASTQPWFADWKRSLPVGGQDGSLAERFAKDPLKNHVFAKTGTLGEARALSGFLEGASGRTVIFSIMVGNHTPRSNADREVMDKIVAAIAAAN